MSQESCITMQQQQRQRQRQRQMVKVFNLDGIVLAAFNLSVPRKLLGRGG